MSYEMLLNEQDASLDIVARKPDLRIKSGDAVHSVTEGSSVDGALEILLDGRPYKGWRYAFGDEVYVRLGARTYIVGLPQARLRIRTHGKSDDGLHADMPGTVIALHVAVGQEVKAGEKLITIESMKLQAVLTAPRDGVIAAIHVPVETAFDRGALLISLAALVQPEAPKAAS